MKKLFILILPIALIMGVTNAQTDSSVQNANLKRKNFRLAFDTPNSSVLKKEELKMLLSDKQFKTYNHARRCYHASIPFFAGAGGIVTASAVLLGIDIFCYGGADIYIIPACALLGYATLFGIIPGIILITHSAKKLNAIALDYNNQRLSSYYQRDVELNFGFTQNGIGFKLNF